MRSSALIESHGGDAVHFIDRKLNKASQYLQEFYVCLECELPYFECVSRPAIKRTHCPYPRFPLPVVILS